MKTNVFKNGSNQQRSKRRVYLLIGILILVFLASGLYLYQKRSSQLNKTDSLTQEEIDNITTGVKDSEDTGVDKEDNSASAETSDPKAHASNPQDSEQTGNLTVTIVSFSQTNGMVNVYAKSGTTEAGNCEVIFSANESRTISKSVNSQDGSCVLSVPEVEFDKVGTWQLSVLFTNNSSKGKTSQNVTIN